MNGIQNGVDIQALWLTVFVKTRRALASWARGEAKDLFEKIKDCVKGVESDLCAGTAEQLSKQLFKDLASENVIVITEGWTRAYFVLKVLQDLARENCPLRGAELSTRFGLERLLDLERVTLITLLEMEEREIPVEERDDRAARDLAYDPNSYTESLINLIAWYAHRALEIPVDLPLADMLRAAYRAEAALYVLKPHYRDHLYHAIDVCMLGHLLLCGDHTGAYRLGEAWDAKEALRVWYVAALFHDVGYMAELVSAAIRALRPLEAAPEISRFQRSLEAGFQAAEREFCLEIYQNVDELREHCVTARLDHGATSAAYLMKFLREIPKGVDTYRPAVDAILAHNLFPQYPIDMSQKPISALLVLCDELQEWGRPAVEFSEYARYLVSTRNLGNYQHAPVRPLGSLSIRFENEVFHFTLEFHQPDEHLFDTAFLWGSKTANFERVKWDDSTCAWGVEILVPQSREYKELQLKEMDLLRSCVWENEELLPLRRWLDLVRKNKWYSDASVAAEGMEMERMTFRLGDFEERPLPAGALEALVTHYFKQRAERLAALRKAY